ncbi:hypothetical protein GLP18_05895 [Streptococcus suis]|uniref:Lipoprotein n=1 Tax=Streptococcus suis TaxID=1307 RepID=A0A6L8MXA6_STRSU|nr:hypothetical protein [Streptococcus suis]
MKRFFILIAVLLVFLLYACNFEKTNFTSNNDSSTSSTFRNIDQAQTNSEESDITYSQSESYYRSILIQSRDEQRHYIESLPQEQQQSVQTTFSAMVKKAEELKQEFSSDKELIEMVLHDLLEEEGQVKDFSTSETSDLIESYANKKNIRYLQGTPATQQKYYGYSVPDELLKSVFLNGNPISFQFYGYVIGEGELYILNDCYVNEAGTELILFVERNGRKYVLESNKSPNNQKIDVFFSQDEILTSY